MLGGIIQKFGARRVLLIGTAGTALGVLMLAVSTNLAWITFVQVYSGVMWAAWELASFLVLLESIKHSERTSMMALYNFTTYFSIAAGSFIGAYVLEFMDTSGSAYVTIFILSGMLRLSVLWLRQTRVRALALEVVSQTPIKDIRT